MEGDGRRRISKLFGFSSGSDLSVVCPMSKFKPHVENREKLAREVVEVWSRTVHLLHINMGPLGAVETEKLWAARDLLLRLQETLEYYPRLHGPDYW